MTQNKTPKNAKNLTCETCHFKCSKNSDYKRHLITAKHSMLQNASKMLQYASKKNATANKQQIKCICGQYYSHSSSYYRHKKKCDFQHNDIEEIISSNEMTDKDLIIMLVKQNTKLMEQNTGLVDILKNNNGQQISNNINSLNNNNNNNKTFNLQFFLNETCKDAMNISDFVSNVKLELEDLEHAGRSGYVEGISNIVIKNLNKLEQHMRPLHCSDNKREVLYIKDNNEWTKETEKKPILTKAIKTIANENIKQINKWRQKYPDCTKYDSKKNDLYLKIVSNSMNGLTKEEGEQNINKIISNVAKKVVIDK
jgi:hypothetical protein